MKTLDDFVAQHEEDCSCAMMCIDDLKYCTCGQPERVKQLAKLRAELIEVQNVIEPFAEAGNKSNDWGLPDDVLICQIPYPQCKDASAWREKWGASGKDKTGTRD